MVRPELCSLGDGWAVVSFWLSQSWTCSLQLKAMNRSVEGFNPEHPVSWVMCTQLAAGPGVCAELLITMCGIEPGLWHLSLPEVGPSRLPKINPWERRGSGAVTRDGSNSPESPLRSLPYPH